MTSDGKVLNIETPRYNIALNETLGSIHCGGVPMSIAVQTDMATPALARYSDDLVFGFWTVL